MGLKAEKGVFATLVVTPVTGGTERIDGLEAIKNYLAGLERAPVSPPRGSFSNPYDNRLVEMPRGMQRLHPRVLNDPEIPNLIKNEIARTFRDPNLITLVEVRGVTSVQVFNKKTKTHYTTRQVVVIPINWERLMEAQAFNVNEADLIPVPDTDLISGLLSVEAKLYKKWKQAQLREEQHKTLKRIKKALAGPADAEFKIGDILVPVHGKKTDVESIFIGYLGTGETSVILLEDGRAVYGSKALYKKRGN